MFYYRLETSLGKYSLLGTTIKRKEDLPQHIVADEKFSSIRGKRVYIATTVAKECILGVSISQSADEENLKKSYSVFKDEAKNLNTKYSPETVNTDGWNATKNAFKSLFPKIVLIRCFFHIYLKIRERSKKKYKEKFLEISEKLWNCFHSETKKIFSQRLRRLSEWVFNQEDIPEWLSKPILTLIRNKSEFLKAYDFKESHRTSNMADRLMQKMELHLKNTKKFHGSVKSANLSIRAWALIQNFAPSNPQTLKKYSNIQSPAERLNGFSYHPNWLHNLFISASLGGYRVDPQNPL
jgi:hypothetical protein